MKIGLLFPGQGAQAVGMGQSLCESSEIARAYYQQASAILGYDLLELCSNGPAEKLNRTEFGQPALFVHSYAALKQLEADRPELWDEVASVAGLSLGEYTAVAAAEGMSFADGVRLVQIRGEAMQAAADVTPSSMSSVIGLEQEILENLCDSASHEDDYVRVANLLCPGNIAISGHTPAIERAEAACSEAGALKTVRLPVAGAFHTAIMQPAVATLEAALQGIDFVNTKVPVYSNVDAEAHSRPEDFLNLLARQVVSPVRWEESLRNMLDAGIDQYIEIGSGRVLAGTLKRIKRKAPCESYGN